MASAGEAHPTVPSRPRRVLIIVENLPVPFDRRVWSEARTLRAAGYEVAVICPKGASAAEKYEYLEGVHIYRHPLPLEARNGPAFAIEYTSALFWEFVYSIRVLRRHGFDVIHACNPPDLIVLIGALYKYLLGKKFVFDHHDLCPELYEAKFGNRGLAWRLLLFFEKLTFRVADVSIEPNDSYRRIAIKRGGMAPERVFTVRSGPNLEREWRKPADPKWKNGRAYLVAYVGVIGEPEGIDLLIEAIAHLVQVKRRTDVQTVVMGDGPALNTVRRQAERAGLLEYVTFTGRVVDATLFTVLSTADVCVNPDRPNTMNDMSTMNKIMEYMALGKPIVQFNLTEGRVSAENASLYARNTDVVDFANKIIELIDDAGKRRRMGAFGLTRVHSKLCWVHEAPKLLKAYSTLFANEALSTTSISEHDLTCGGGTPVAFARARKDKRKEA